MTTVTVRMDDELAARLRQHADAAGVSPDELVERALSRFLDERPASRHLEFFGIGSSEVLRGDWVDELLTEGFGS
jgi:Ribbon-helix-helix protein, copG family